MKFIRSSRLSFPKKDSLGLRQAGFETIGSTYNQYIIKELKNLSRMISYAKDLHSFTLCLDVYDINKEQELDGICQKLKSLKNISSMIIQLSTIKITEAKVERLLKITTIQKKLSKLYISYNGSSILKTGVISFNKTIASCKNLADLSVYLGLSIIELPCLLKNKFFSEISKVIELKALSLTFSEAVNTNKEFFESITQCFKNLKNLQGLNLTFYSCRNIKDEDLQIMAQQLSEFNELSHFSLSLRGVYTAENINTAIENISNSVQALKNLKNFEINLDRCVKINEKVLHSSIHKISAHTSLTNLTLHFGEINIPDSFIMLGNLCQL